MKWRLRNRSACPHVAVRHPSCCETAPSRLVTACASSWKRDDRRRSLGRHARAAARPPAMVAMSVGCRARVRVPPTLEDRKALPVATRTGLVPIGDAPPESSGCDDVLMLLPCIHSAVISRSSFGSRPVHASRQSCPRSSPEYPRERCRSLGDEVLLPAVGQNHHHVRHCLVGLRSLCCRNAGGLDAPQVRFAVHDLSTCDEAAIDHSRLSKLPENAFVSPSSTSCPRAVSPSRRPITALSTGDSPGVWFVFRLGMNASTGQMRGALTHRRYALPSTTCPPAMRRLSTTLDCRNCPRMLSSVPRPRAVHELSRPAVGPSQPCPQATALAFGSSSGSA